MFDVKITFSTSKLEILQKQIQFNKCSTLSDPTGTHLPPHLGLTSQRKRMRIPTAKSADVTPASLEHGLLITWSIQSVTPKFILLNLG